VKSDKNNFPDFVTSESFDVFFEDPCLSEEYISLSLPMGYREEPSPAPNSYDGSLITFNYVDYEVYPPCGVETTCVSVSGPSDALDCREIVDGKVTWMFKPEDVQKGVIPGDYIYTYEVKSGPKKEYFKIKLTLVDPCLTPDVTAPLTTPMEYTITDYDQTVYLDRKYSISPSSCPWKYRGTKDLDEDLSYVEFNNEEGYFKIN